REVLLSDGLEKDSLPAELRDALAERMISHCPGWVYERDYASGLLCGQFGAASAEALGLEQMPVGMMAAGAALYYLRENRKSAIPNIRDIRVYQRSEHLALDPATRRNLEITATMAEGRKAGSLLGCLDKTATAMGARRLKQWHNYPLVGLEAIRQRLDAVQELLDAA